MLTREILEGMTAEQVMQQLQEVKDRYNAAIVRANDAINDYQKAVNMRDSKISDLVKNVTKQLADNSTKTTALKSALLKATIADDTAEQAKIKASISKLANQRATLNAQLELLREKPPLCDEAYADMEKAVAESQDADVQYSADIRVIREFCEDVMQPWTEVISTLRHSGAGVSRFYLDRARSHYSNEKVERN